MIIVNLYGGLGNQMFQYALGRSLAHKHNCILKLDISGFQNYDLRKYELENFTIVENFATQKDLNAFLDRPKTILGKGLKKARKIMKMQKIERCLKEEYYHFNPEVLNASNNIYIEGYWQSEKYFCDIEDIIRNDFTFKEASMGENLELYKRIKNTDSISLHVRRGDYISNPVTNEFHGTCGVDYYRSAIKMITAKYNNPVFYIFSDEPEWAKKNIVLSNPTVFIDNNSLDKGYEDLRLMSMCKHNIIANSSFSWWGAWLNKNKDKTVIAPKKWFNKTDIDTSDLIPDSWIRI